MGVLATRVGSDIGAAEPQRGEELGELVVSADGGKIAASRPARCLRRNGGVLGRAARRARRRSAATGRPPLPEARRPGFRARSPARSGADATAGASAAGRALARAAVRGCSGCSERSSATSTSATSGYSASSPPSSTRTPERSCRSMGCSRASTPDETIVAPSAGASDGEFAPQKRTSDS